MRSPLIRYSMRDHAIQGRWTSEGSMLPTWMGKEEEILGPITIKHSEIKLLGTEIFTNR